MYTVTIWTYRNLKREIWRSTLKEARDLQVQCMKDPNIERSTISEKALNAEFTIKGNHVLSPDQREFRDLPRDRN